jgi:hypothetical protein
VTEFEELTPYEFKLIANVFMENEKAKAEKDLMISYMTAYFQRVEKLEPFETYRQRLDGVEAEPIKKGMSVEEMLQKVTQIHESMNGQTK